MKAVGRFEADLLRVLAALLGRAPIEGALRIIIERHPHPRCLRRAAVELISDGLAKGCVWRLARDGGWARARHLRGEAVVSGRLWERTPPEALGLRFSRHALDLLIWLVAEHPGDRPARWDPPEDALAPGDRLLMFFAYEALRGTGVRAALLGVPAFERHGLIRLAYPEDMVEAGVDGPFDLSPWVVGPESLALEALQPRLAGLWAATERRKGAVTAGAWMRALGRAQERALDALLPACEAAGRLDLARFLLEAASPALEGRGRAEDWVGGLAVAGLRLADRTELYRSAGAYLRVLGRLRDLERRARAVGYFDEGYAAAQLWKSDWERLGGEAAADRAARLLRDLDPLATGA